MSVFERVEGALMVLLLIDVVFARAESAAQTTLEPERPRQGQVLFLHGPGEAVRAQLINSAGKTTKAIDLFPAAPGKRFGLLPVPVLTAPGPYRVEWLDASGAASDKRSITVLSAHFARQNITLTPALSALRSSSDERERVASFFHQTADDRFWQEPLHKPLPGCVTSPFGAIRLHNGKLTGDFHAGLDQRGTEGSPIYVTAAGKVGLAQRFPLRGGTVAIDHGQGLKSMYLHMSRIAVVEGQMVKAGEVIGYVGSTGRSTAPHLHWSMYASGEAIDPNQWMSFESCKSTTTPEKRYARPRSGTR